MKLSVQFLFCRAFIEMSLLTGGEKYYFVQTPAIGALPHTTDRSVIYVVQCSFGKLSLSLAQSRHTIGVRERKREGQGEREKVVQRTRANNWILTNRSVFAQRGVERRLTLKRESGDDRSEAVLGGVYSTEI